MIWTLLITFHLVGPSSYNGTNIRSKYNAHGNDVALTSQTIEFNNLETCQHYEQKLIEKYKRSMLKVNALCIANKIKSSK